MGEERQGSTRSGRSISRRQFLKLSGTTGAALALTGGIGTLLEACGSTKAVDTTATTTAAPITTATVASTTLTTAAASATTVSTGTEAGREIKIGYETPKTGQLAAFGVADSYCLDKWRVALADGLVCGDGKKHPIKIIDVDNQSDTARAASTAGELIASSKVDVITATSADMVPPVADQAEAAGCPCVTVDAPADAFFLGRNGDPNKGFKWTYHAFWGFAEVIPVTLADYSELPTNKKIAAVWPNSIEGNTYRSILGKAFPAAGYTVVDPGAYTEPLDDFTNFIQQFKKAGCEILEGALNPPDFAVLWGQMNQQGWVPKVCSVAKPLLFPQSVEALSEGGLDMHTLAFWHPTFPFKSSLTGETCQEIADDFEAKTGMQWTQPIIHYLTMELVIDALKRTTNVDDKESIIKAVSTINLADSVAGPIDFTAPIKEGTARVYPNVVSTPIFGAQWVKGTKHKFDLIVISNSKPVPYMTIQGSLQPLPGATV